MMGTLNVCAVCPGANVSVSRLVAKSQRPKAAPCVAAQLTGRQIAKLASRKDIFAITLDAPVILQGNSTSQLWPSVAGLQGIWNLITPGGAPTIAIVDSGLDASRPDFYGRVLANVNLSSLSQNSPGDGYGHGTLVAGIAAGAADGYAGGAPRAKLLSLDVRPPT